MKKIYYYCTNTCSTCKKARVWLEEKGYEITYRNFETEPLLPEEIKALAKKAGVTPVELLNPRSRNLKNDGIDLETITEDEAIKAIGHCYKYLYRPIAISENGKTAFGFNAKKYEEIF